MNDEHLMLLGSIKADLEHIKKSTDATNDKISVVENRISSLESWRNGLVVASTTIGTMLVGLGVTLQKALATIIHP
jgi:hypothetical protein